MRAKTAKDGSVHIQQSMFATDDLDNLTTVTYGDLFTVFLQAYREGRDPADAMIYTRLGRNMSVQDVPIQPTPEGTPIHWRAIRDHARAEWESHLAEQQPKTASAEVAYEAMMDALRDKIDPFMVEIKADSGAYVRVCQASIRGMGGAQMSVYELLKIVRMDHRDEMQAAREEVENLVTDDFSM